MPKQRNGETPVPPPGFTGDDEAGGGPTDFDASTPFEAFTHELAARASRWVGGHGDAPADMGSYTRIYHELVDEWRRGNVWNERWGVIPGHLWQDERPRASPSAGARRPPSGSDVSPGAGELDGSFSGTVFAIRQNADDAAASPGTDRPGAGAAWTDDGPGSLGGGNGRSQASPPAPITLPPYNPPAAKARERSVGGTVTLSVGRRAVDSALESPFNYLRDGHGVAVVRRRSEQLRRLHLGGLEEEEEEAVGAAGSSGDTAAAEAKRGTKRALDAEAVGDEDADAGEAGREPKRQATGGDDCGGEIQEA